MYMQNNEYIYRQKLRYGVAFYLQTRNDKFLATSKGAHLSCLIAAAVLLAAGAAGVAANVTVTTDCVERGWFTEGRLTGFIHWLMALADST
jgi:hypothetical protein